MRQSSVILHECRSISGISFHNDLSSVFKVIPSFKEASLHSLANALLVLLLCIVSYCACNTLSALQSRDATAKTINDRALKIFFNIARCIGHVFIGFV